MRDKNEEKFQTRCVEEIESLKTGLRLEAEVCLCALSGGKSTMGSVFFSYSFFFSVSFPQAREASEEEIVRTIKEVIHELKEGLHIVSK